MTVPSPEAATHLCVSLLSPLSHISLFTSSQSTGRGGVGNIRCASASRDARPDTGPDDFSPARGREPQPRLAESSPNHVISTGRGGAGNIRSPSRDAHSSATAEAAEKLVIRAHLAEGAAVRTISSSLIITPKPHTAAFDW